MSSKAQRTRERAYQIWEEEGRPEGRGTITGCKPKVAFMRASMPKQMPRTVSKRALTLSRQRRS